uniref:Sperm-associated antigen 5 n=1 Tax=Cyanoderma ruficeps TaxID=181631 RepID=A0A8C3P3I9_9PASS
MKPRPLRSPPPAVAPPQPPPRGAMRVQRSLSEPRVLFKPAVRAGGGGAARPGTRLETKPNPAGPGALTGERTHIESHRSRSRDQDRERGRAMKYTRTPAAQRRPRPTPLRELQVQSGADRTTLTPLFRRLRLKDHDCATPVSRAQGTCSIITAVPCTPEPRRSATLGLPGSTNHMPCILEPPSSTTLESPRTSFRGLKTPILKPDASEAPSNATLIPGALETSSSTSTETPGSPISVSSSAEVPDNTVPVPLRNPVLGPSTPEPSSSTVPASVCSSAPVPSTPEPSSSTVPASVCSSTPVPSTPEPSSSTIPVPVCSSIRVSSTREPSSIIPVPLCSSFVGSSTPERPGNTVPVSPCSSIPVTLESPGSTTPGLPNIISSVSCTPTSPGSSVLPPCRSRSPGNASTASCTPGPPGTSSTPQKAPFHGWQATPPDFSCSFGASEPSSANGSADPLHQGTPEGAEFPAPVPPEQSPPGLPPIETSGLEPAGPEATVIPVTMPESTLDAVSWMLPLVWLEKTLNASFLVESLWHSLSLHKPQQDANSNVTPVPTAVTSTTPVPTTITGTSTTLVPTMVTGTSMTPVPTMVTGTSMTPVPTAVTGTSMTPVPTAVTGTSTTPVPTVVTGTSTTPVPTVVTGTSMTPVPTAVAGTCTTPVLSMATGTFMTPRDVWERSMNTSRGSLPCAVEVDSLLWHCPQEHLKTLPRAELEGRLESSLIIMKALLLQLRDWLKSQRPQPGVGPAKQRDAFTQTDTTHPEGSTCSSQSLLFQDLVGAAFRNLQDKQGALTHEREQERTLESQCQAVLESVPRKVQSCLEKRDAIRQQVDEVLQDKDQAYLFLEAFCAHASTQIRACDQSLASQQELSTLLAHAINLQASLSAKRQSFREFLDVTFENLEKERRALDEEREQTRALVSQSRALLERVPGKLRSCLEELAATRERAEEALQAKEEASCQLEKTLVTLQETGAQLEQLTVANSRLGKDLNSVMINLASVEQERDALQQKNEEQQMEMAQLSKERSSLQQECKQLCQELRETTECREFLDQENQMCHTQLLEVEARLSSTLATLQERVLQHEELMESHQRLWEEQAALSKELDILQKKRNKISWCSMDIMESKMRLQELADCLKAALEEQDDDDAPSSSKAWTPGPRTLGWQTPRCARTPVYCTPHHASSSFVGSVLKAVAGKDANETTRSQSAVAKDKLASVPKPIDSEDTLLESVKELRDVVSNLAMLSSRIQELEQSKFRALQTEISDLQFHLETVTTESQEKVDTQAATIASLNKMLRAKLENEKELQDVVKEQEEKLLQLIDQSGEVTRLKTEVFQLKRSLQRAETEAKVLWEEIRGKEDQVDITRVKERVMQRREVEKLRLLLVERENENTRVIDKYLVQIQGLEMKLHHTQKVLRTHEEMQRKMKEVLSAVPELAVDCQELQSLLCCLGLKPASEEAAEPQ